MLPIRSSVLLIVEIRKKKKEKGRETNDRTATITTISIRRLEKGGTRYQFRVREERSRPISDV